MAASGWVARQKMKNATGHADVQRKVRILHEGVVEKQGRHLKLWKRRKLQLAEDFLSWSQPGEAIPIDRIWLDGKALVHVGQVPPGSPGIDGCCFQVVHDDIRIVIRCENQEQLDKWVKEINAAVKDTKDKCASGAASFVYLNVYNLSNNAGFSMLNFITKDVLEMGGAFHGGIEVYGKEYSFGSGNPDQEVAAKNVIEADCGIGICEPRCCSQHQYSRSECLGMSQLSEKQVAEKLKKMAPDWPSQGYDILSRNCVSFCREFSDRLGVDGVPLWVDSFAKAGSNAHLLDDKVLQGEDDGEEVRDPEGHGCKLVVQSFLGGFFESIECEDCEKELERGEPRWRCDVCDFDLCKPCSLRRRQHAKIAAASANG
eukprot:gnl/TRDRNA2_/TRDRNA2_94349_c0_seq1.p1 gnl/TRDRNA2_/TRDRNA2_94349_c0~~gnl/TRDRNA2_/TRDRNA2_94349_c0_seq1.p1  ORF type:complete len:407 (-),score=69.41 gnl/TRDRNA2_/TRDRNA2_94349_c0_seq1:98-1213(-)